MTTATPAILVVEDELLLRLMAVDVVETSGFEALSAATADEALSILEARADDVRLVFTDIHMPGSDWRTPFATAGRPSN
jgi:CheY-like chemotaxis protein